MSCTCQGCTRLFTVDVIVPDSVWERIKPEGKPEGGGLLCPHCVFERLNQRGPFADLPGWKIDRAKKEWRRTPLEEYEQTKYAVLHVDQF